MSTRKRVGEDDGRNVRAKVEEGAVIIEGGPVAPGAPSKPMSDEELAQWNAMFFELMVSVDVLERCCVSEGLPRCCTGTIVCASRVSCSFML